MNRSNSDGDSREIETGILSCVKCKLFECSFKLNLFFYECSFSFAIGLQTFFSVREKRGIFTAESNLVDYSGRSRRRSQYGNPKSAKTTPSQANAEANNSDNGRDYSPSDESETIGDRISGGEAEADTVEKIRAGGIGRGGHRLEVSPGGLLNEAVADRDFVAGVRGGGGGRRVDGGGGGEDVLEGGVGLGGGLEGEEPQVNRRGRRRGENGAVWRSHGGGGGNRNRVSAAENWW